MTLPLARGAKLTLSATFSQSFVVHSPSQFEPT
jgi:hypothetical protein